MALSVPDIIAIAKVSQFLAENDNLKGSIFGKRVAPNTGKILYCERKAVEWMYNLDSTDDTLTLTSNYLYSLCRGYNLKAKNIYNQGGGGTITPISPSSAPNPIQFEVASDTAIVTGATSGVITNFIGYNLLFVRGGIPQSTVNQGGGSSYYSWDRTTGTLTISPAAVVGELFQLYPI